MNNDDLPPSAKLSRRVLKIILIPVLFLGIILRFTAPSWADTVFLVLLPVIVVFAIVGRIFTFGK